MIGGKRLGVVLGLLVAVSIISSCKTETKKEAVTTEKTVTKPTNKARAIITTDGEVDDIDSYIRMLLLANEFDIEGLIYSSSQWHYSGDGKGTMFTSEMELTRDLYGTRDELRWPGTTWMQALLDKYDSIYPNLKLHADGFPTPAKLKSLVRVGNIKFEGEMEEDTEGSDLIKKVLLDDNPRDVNIQAWGGSNTFARALKAIEDEYKPTPQWDSIYEKVSQKTVFYAILDQDATYKKYIAPNWPKIRVIYNSDQFWCFAYPWPERVPEKFHKYFLGDWYQEHILTNHSALLGEYYTWGDGRQVEGDYEQSHGQEAVAKEKGRKKYDFISEGDSPSYFFLLKVGLNDTLEPTYGSWGGRFAPVADNPYRWEDGENATDYNPYTQMQDKIYPQGRWVGAIQNEFAARADWCLKPYEEANHPPSVTLKGENILKAKAGAQLTLEIEASDPDGDALAYSWWQYHEADTYTGQLQLDAVNSNILNFTIPEDALANDTIHLIVEVTDNGAHPMTRYQRIIVNITG